MNGRPYTDAEDEYVVWAVRHGATNRELAHDLGRSTWSVEQKIKALRQTHDLPVRQGRGKVKEWNR